MKKVIIASRHEPIIKYLKRYLTPEGALDPVPIVITGHCTAEDVTGADVYGELPVALAALCNCYVSVHLPPGCPRDQSPSDDDYIRTHVHHLQYFVAKNPLKFLENISTDDLRAELVARDNKNNNNNKRRIKMKKYEATWKYGQSCLRKGQVVAECEAKSIAEFASQLCNVYAFELGDGFSFARYESQEDIRSAFGDDLPEWGKAVTSFPALVFTSNCGEEVLCNPSDKQIIDQVRNEHYGDYDLVIKGI